jgi:hypothetical protein
MDVDCRDGEEEGKKGKGGSRKLAGSMTKWSCVEEALLPQKGQYK